MSDQIILSITLVLLVLIILLLFRPCQKEKRAYIRKCRKLASKQVETENLIEKSKIVSKQLNSEKKRTPIIYKDAVITEMDESITDKTRSKNMVIPDVNKNMFELDGYA